MDIVCNQCHTKLSIPDHKVPRGKRASFLCPKCKQRIQISPSADSSGPSMAPTRTYDAADKPFDFVDSNKQTSLVCMGSGAAVVSQALETMGHVVKQAKDVEHALLNMRYHLFDIVVVDDGFDRPGVPGVLSTLCQLEMASRRKIFVILVSERYRTMDSMAALHQSVNLVVNHSSLNKVDKIIDRAIKENEQFYAVFKDSLKKTGKG
ncbi:hypothetical protein HRM2_05010 [Desulforapulum autotrophicum HRM2]|uniref:Zinc finger/thioredoxin putative domain-containing protein n=2 Tax=Desulforapulum autotrophicum TaxID=2296 RepID=C0QHQ7_DESAH|nr:hypothetical protein HRM2_05010 [Desulforapulum autotrophicum HRM2]